MHLFLACLLALIFFSQSVQVTSDEAQSPSEPTKTRTILMVTGDCTEFDFEDYHLLQLRYEETGKNKRKTYAHFNRNYDRILHILEKRMVLPHKESHIETAIQMNFIPRRRVWEFSRTFSIYCLE